MRAFLIFLSIVLAAAIVIIAEYNSPFSLVLNIPFVNIKFASDLAIIIIGAFAFGVLTGFILLFAGYLKQLFENKKLKKRLEKENLFMENSDARVSVLQNKIKTLEAALERALKDDKTEE